MTRTGPWNDRHFSALILRAEIRIHAGGEIKICRAGDVFHLRRDEPHRESYGPEGADCLSGRRSWLPAHGLAEPRHLRAPGEPPG